MRQFTIGSSLRRDTKIEKLDTKSKFYKQMNRSLCVGTLDLSNATKKHTTKSRENIPLGSSKIKESVRKRSFLRAGFDPAT
jgi:hypothetical protein